ncbi:hypothetical protein XA68_17251 [Ophiocordyceps unilateralis]|uniref:Dicer-like protein 1 n=1 Tax=Ophiocordyceps unilateralis TaxID=268505 RepID=A0A2A9PS20_OPHUN|nr:hypothetical protein XA68_17251 [Ophiocordyceps unilateralis]
MASSATNADRMTPLAVMADAAPENSSTTPSGGVSSPPFQANDAGDVVSDSEDDNAIDRYRYVPDQVVDPRAPSARRRRGDAAFQQWIVESQRTSTAPAEQVQSVDRFSTVNLIQRNEEKRIIASPREYQTELFERAKDKNLIIVLDTGSGKTLIAALLLRHTLDQELERRAVGEAHRVAFFLVDKVALCVQQYSVLRANLEHPVARFHGEMAGVMRTKEYWDQQLASNMVFVCTARVLLDCLNNGFLQMRQINLLIFDEAHHTKKNHAYARIIKDHYRRQPGDARPRILGMTASPVDTQTRDLRAAASELETMLCSEIATVSDETLMQNQAQRQQIELCEYYARLVPPEDARTTLWNRLAALMSDDYGYRVHLESSQEAASTLGPRCADRYWELLVTEAEIVKRTGQAHAEGEADKVEEKMRKVQKMIRENAAKAQPRADDFSSKFKALRSYLEDAFTRQDTRRCIVFVQKRYTALLLADAFEHADQRVNGMNPSYTVGSQALSGLVNMSFRDQVLALQRFRRGETNCLFATQVAEEGIDIPECDLIIRFDIYDSAIQYIQSKGRARQARSTYVSMLEHGNVHHLRRLKQATRDANALRRFCSSLPADRRLQSYAHDLDQMLENEHIMQKSYEIKATGARLTYVSSLEILNKFVASLDASASPEYIITYLPTKKFKATVILPESSPIQSQEGSPQRNKQMARCAAAYIVCVKLIEQNYINEHLQPVLRKRLPQMRNARLALNSNKKDQYPMRVKPDVWSQLGPPTDVFGSLLSLAEASAPGRQTTPLMIITRFPLPRLEPTMLYFDDDRRTTALVGSPLPLKLSTDEAEALTQFTLAIFKDVFSKEYSARADDMPYLLAPVTVTNGIDWDVAALAAAESPDWSGAADDFFDQKLVMDPWDGSRKFIICGIDKRLKPSDAVPEGAPEPKSRAYRDTDKSIKEYSNSLARMSRRRQNWREDQPVVKAELLPLRRNFLDETGGEETRNRRCWLILEPLRVSTLPVDIVSMALLVPVMMFRLDSALIATEACSKLDLAIQPSLALEALTKDSCNTEEHGQEQVDFQVGMGPNYERLELLGDAFLKMATTISLFTLLPGYNEFHYHVERMMLVCNLNLFNHAVGRKLQEYIRSKAFDRRSWYPNLQLKKGKLPKTQLWQSLSDKSIADVCEALIGAAYLTGGRRKGEEGSNGMDLAVKAVTKMVRSKLHKMTKFEHYRQAFQMPSWQTDPPTAAQRAAIEPIYKATGYRFRYPKLLRSAFKHPSYPYEDAVPNYQRLEFLGDALLDMVTVDHLFHRFPHADPQCLTEHKMVLVSNHFFGYLAVRLGLQRHLLLTTSSLMGQVSEYVAELEMVEQQEGEGRRDVWLKTSAPPKALSDMLEALVGAMFVDADYDLDVVRRFFATLIQPQFQDMSPFETLVSSHPVTALTHLLQDDFACQDWRLCVSTVPCAVERGAASMTDEDIVCALMLHGRAVESATAKAGREAKAAAADKALALLKGLTKPEFRNRVGCDCGGVGGGVRA